MKSALAFALLITLFLPANGAAPAIPEPAKSRARQRVDAGYTPGVAIGMVNADGRTYFTYGARSWEDKRTPDEHSLFEIGSVTKVFTTTLLAMMVQRGEVSLADELNSFLPEGIRAPEFSGRKITLLHLATHRSGLPANPDLDFSNPANPFANYPESKLYEFLGQYQLTRAPGAAYEYSNLGVALLGRMLARRAGKPYETLLRERILDPLGLADTRITLDADQTSRRLPGHSGVVERPPFRMDSLEAAGALYSTLDNLLTFLESATGIRTNQVQAAVAEAIKRRADTSYTGISTGLAWWIWNFNSVEYLQHGGDTMGQTAFIGFRRGSKTAVVVLSNARANTYTSVIDLGFYLLGAPYPLTVIPKPATVSVTTLRHYHGRYANANGTSFEARLVRDQLTLAYSGDNGLAFTVYPLSDRSFQALDVPGNAGASFRPDAQGRADTLTWSQGGVESDYGRVPIPARLAISLQSTDLQIALTGDTDTNYVIEESANFRQWAPVSTNSIWDSPIRWPATNGAGGFFYRVRAP